MAKTLTARLDEKSQRELSKLSRTLGKTESEIVRESIHLMASTQIIVSKGKPRMIGLGQFASGLTDLASNKKYLDDFGQ
ncbi:MAG: ribbon-helix-helix protein, CopG family [Deltaproteobacteria bacterium]|nr:ribbon-helix-helix protein, CopG family [Deltaproteobacteria bacterium]